MSWRKAASPVSGSDSTVAELPPSGQGVAAEAGHSTGMDAQSAYFRLGNVALIGMFLSTLIWRNSSGDATPPMGNTENYYRILLVAFSSLAAAIVLVRDPRTWGRAFPGPLILMLVYGTLALVSSAYIPQYAFYSMWKSLEVVVVVLAAAAVLSYEPSTTTAATAYRTFVGVCSTLLVLFAIEAILVPQEALHPARGALNIQMKGYLPNYAENALAFLAAVTAFGSFTRMFRPASLTAKLLNILFFMVASVVLVLAQSRTSFVGFCFAVVTYLWFDRRFGWLAILAVVAVLAGTFASFFGLFTEYLLRGQDPELVGSLSGRTQGWESAWRAYQEAPFFGHGFAAYARSVILAEDGVTSLHGAVFEVMVGTGTFGLVAWFGSIAWTMFRLFMLPSSGNRWFQSEEGRGVRAELLGIAVLIILRGSTSSGLAENEDNLILFLTLLVFTETVRRAGFATPERVSSENYRVLAPVLSRTVA